MLQRREGFQSSTNMIEATIQKAAIVLCNDKPQTFGAPDVLQVTASQASAQYTMSMFFPDRPPNQAARLGLAISASFLNNSSSRWEAICESWAVEAELVDTVSPIYRSDHHRQAVTHAHAQVISIGHQCQSLGCASIVAMNCNKEVLLNLSCYAGLNWCNPFIVLAICNLTMDLGPDMYALEC